EVLYHLVIVVLEPTSVSEKLAQLRIGNVGATFFAQGGDDGTRRIWNRFVKAGVFAAATPPQLWIGDECEPRSDRLIVHELGQTADVIDVCVRADEQIEIEGSRVAQQLGKLVGN